ncbi:MAG: hypothetical protein PCFJNLEI_03761 [Verrucomicrobiae bacterium]|nr:hypothetical protein [Verrucomicrobiae bacterium]
MALGLVLAVACSTSKSTHDEDGPLRYADSVQIARFDSENRPPSDNLELFQTAEQIGNRPYKTIALVSRTGLSSNEGLILNAIIYRAKLLGATGLIPAAEIEKEHDKNTVNIRVGFRHFGDGPSKAFRYFALVFETAAKSP